MRLRRANRAYARRIVVTCAALAAVASVAHAQRPLWIEAVSGGDAGDRAMAVALDGVGGAFVGGSTNGGLGIPLVGIRDIWLARYDGGGSRTWIVQFGSAASDYLLASSPDGSGGGYVAGQTLGALAGPAQGHLDAWVARHDAGGALIWATQLGTSSRDVARAVAPDGAGGVYVAGSTSGALGGPLVNTLDAWVARYDSAGNRAWIRQFGFGSHAQAHAVLPDGTGGVFVCGGDGGSWVARYDGTGSQLWFAHLGMVRGGASALASDRAGGVIVAGSDYMTSVFTASPQDAWTARFDGGGNRLWLERNGSIHGERIAGCVSDGVGGAIVVREVIRSPGTLAQYESIAVDRFDAAGARRWTSRLTQFGPFLGGAVAADGSGGAWLVGAGAVGGGAFTPFVARFDGGLTASHYCAPSVPNSTGASATIEVEGSSAVWLNDLTLVASDLPPHELGIFVNSRSPGSAPPAGSTQGTLCLSGTIGRHSNAVFDAGALGQVSVSLDLTALPSNATVSVMAGETWYFQGWYRDANPGRTSNFTDAVSVTFQ